MLSENSHIFVLGGARSGKSVFAENLALSYGKATSSKCIYLATSQIWDDEMRARVDVHKERRSAQWDTIEVPLELPDALIEHAEKECAILVDCLTLWVTNLMMEERDLNAAGDELVNAISSITTPIIFVSNEVGQGIVPDNKMARDFRDHAGILHQKLAAVVDEVYFITAGLPTKLKG
ncbi:MAG: bifunctional adenosylcobinamide kinase/adenosylcobinamide-phosphate guanylyltransferase [Lentilitoribacter sp.]